MSFSERSKGFTLLELVVGLSIAGSVLTAAIGILVLATSTMQQNRAEAFMARELSVASQILSRDIRVAGLGVPRANLVGSPAVQNNRAVIVALGDAIGLQADLPRPDANFPTFGLLDARPAGAGNIAFHTDNNGSCAPDSRGGSLSCRTGERSVLFAGENGCASVGAEKDRTCAWGMKRLRDDDSFQIVASDGTYANGKIGALRMTSSSAPEGHGVYALAGITGWPATWPNNVGGAAPLGIRTMGFVSTVDRVFYRHHRDTRTLQRMQCWGPALGNDPNWPPTTGALPAAPESVAGNTCTTWEPILRNVEAVTFTYGTCMFCDPNSEVTFRLKTSKLVGTRPVTQEVTEHISLRNTFGL
jgi:prepilin-type N-terminal cleavage/methylation domain-containing protein